MRKTQVMNFSQGKKVLCNILTKTESQRYGKIKKSYGDTTDAVKSEEKTINYLKDVALFYDNVEKIDR